MARTCELINLEDKQTLNVLPGASFQGGVVVPTESRFSCCDGSGLNLDMNTNKVSRCDLKWRLNQTQSLLVQLAQTWGPEYAKQLINEKLSIEELGWLIQLKKGIPKKGFYRVSQRSKAGPSRFWLMALAAVWRFGLPSHMVTLQKQVFGKLLPKEEQHASKYLLFTENIDALWKPEPLYDLETLISFCDRSVYPLFCEFKIGEFFQKRDESNQATRKSRFTQKIEKKKSQFPLFWLEKDMIGRFELVCEKIDLHKLGARDR